MAYNTEKLTKLEALKALAERIKSDYATKASVDILSDRVDGLVAEGGEPNIITAIKVNGTAQTITNKAVDIKVPTKTSELSNDSKYQSDTQVAAAIQTAIAASGHASFQKVDKVTGKGLSTNDYTNAEKSKLAGLSNYTHPSHTAKASGLYKVTVDALGHVSAATAAVKADITALGIPGQDTTYVAATASAAGLMSAADKTKLDSLNVATTAEVAEMLAEVFA